MKLSLVRHPPLSLPAAVQISTVRATRSFRLAKTKKEKKTDQKKLRTILLLGEQNCSPALSPTSLALQFLKILLSLFFHCSDRNVAVLLLLPLGKISLQNWFSLRVYLRRCPRIESYTLHKEQTNSFFNAPLAGFQMAMKHERFDGMKARSLEMFFMFWKHKPTQRRDYFYFNL